MHPHPNPAVPGSMLSNPMSSDHHKYLILIFIPERHILINIEERYELDMMILPRKLQ